jgi:hypothetical protein
LTFALTPITRSERVETRKAEIFGRYNGLLVFLDLSDSSRPKSVMSRMSSPLRKVCAVVLLLLAVPAVAHAEPCGAQAFGGVSYLVCSFDLTRDNLRTYWRRDDGGPYRTFAAGAKPSTGVRSQIQSVTGLANA